MQLLGMLLWRGGLALSGAAGLYYGAWQFVRELAWPAPVKVGIALALTGGALVVVSLILERVKDAAPEENLSD